jgi:NhaP-type Na+/H+ or K+/H+ antiporter
MDKKLDPISAVEESWKKTRGHGWTIFWMAIVSFFICIAGFCVFFVGIIPAAIWIHSSFASLYDTVITENA